MIEPFLSAVPVLKMLEDAGFEAYFVGGSVRDFLLNKRISDVDIATSATPDEVKTIFPKTVDIGIEHGTVLVLYDNESYEITTFRTEDEYVNYRRPKEVSFIRSLNEDLQRRDFTMNAIAMDRNGKLIDPFKGKSAIEEKRIQTVGNADDRFQEDALRMMRAVRFVSQLSFHIEGNTMKALPKLVHFLENIAVERKRAEFEKILVGQNRSEAIRLTLETNLFSYLPGLENSKKQLEKLISYNFESLTLIEMWSLLIFCLDLKEEKIEPFLRDWRLPVIDIREIQHILSYTRKRFVQEWSIYDLYAGGINFITSAEKLYLIIKGIEEIESIQSNASRYEKLPIKNRRELAVSGNDLMEWFGRNSGPWLKETILNIEHGILEGKVMNDKRQIKEWLINCNQN